MEKTAVFKAGAQTVSVLLDDTGQCAIPWEVLGEDCCSHFLFAGVYGTREEAVVLPTVWASCGKIRMGVTPSADAQDFTPGIFEQVLGRLSEKQERLNGVPGQTVGFDEDGNAMAVYVLDGGEQATIDHRALTHRDDEDQHPIEAISGLEEISNLEILKIWNGGN